MFLYTLSFSSSVSEFFELDHGLHESSSDDTEGDVSIKEVLAFVQLSNLKF